MDTSTRVPTDDPLFTVREAAIYLGVTPRTVENYIALGELRSGRIGRGPKAHHRIFRSECDRFLFGEDAT